MVDDTHAETIGDRITKLAEGKGKSHRAISLAVSGTPDLVRDIIRRGHAPNADNLVKLAQELGTTVEYLMGETADQAPVRSEVEVADVDTDWRASGQEWPGIPLMGTGDCADIELCTESGEMIAIERSSFDDEFPIRMITRPPALRGARDIYAIYFQGESMLPRFEPGELGLVDPGRPVRIGEYVLVQLTNGEEEHVHTVLVKRLVRQNATEVVLEQFNPPAIFTVPKTRVARIHRILPQTDLLFG